MKYFKNTELAKIYNVSEKSVRNWIESAQSGKLDLQLQQEKDKFYIANTTKNTSVIEGLVTRGKKYKNTRGYKRIKPSEKFYRFFNSKEIFDIISNIDIHREIPHQYSYFNEGAVYWDLYTNKLAEEKLPNALHYNHQLLQLNFSYLDDLLEPYQAVNVIDIGPGNGMPVKQLLQHLNKKSLLRRYIALDISQDMLDIARQNVKSWFGEAVQFEAHVRDINYDRFNDLIMTESFGKEGIINLVLFLGDTISNFRDSDHALTTIHDSMGKNDLLIFSGKLDTEKSRRYFDFNVASRDPRLGFRGKTMLDLLGIDASYYSVEEIFNKERRARQRQIRLNVALSIEFELDGERQLLELHKDETLLLWQARHRNAIEIINEFDRNNLELLQTTETKDQQYFKVIAKIKTGLGN